MEGVHKDKPSEGDKTIVGHISGTILQKLQVSSVRPSLWALAVTDS